VPDTFSPAAQLDSASRLALVRVKVQRAKKHLVDLERELIAFGRRTQANVELTEDGPQIGIQQYRNITIRRVLPFEAISCAGDIIQNLRSSLDHLAYQLVLVNGNQPTPRTAFPICEDCATYKRDKIRKIEGMRDDAKEAIDRLKPYRGGNDLLWKLHSLNNIDKHRLLFTVSEDVVFEADWIGSPFGFLLKASDPNFLGIFDRKTEDEIQLEISKTVSNPQILQGDSLLPTLHQMVDAVEDLIFSFRPILE
jgi:hypothetical protein